MSGMLYINSTTNIIENIIEVGGGYSVPSGYYIEPVNGQNIGNTYDAEFYIAHVVDVNGLYLGDYPYNDYPEGGTIVPSSPDDTRMSWDFENNLWYWAKNTLKNILSQYRSTKQIGGIFVNENTVPTDLQSIAYYTAIYLKITQEISTENRAFSLSNHDCTNMQNSDIAEFLDQILDHLQRCMDAEKSVFDDIDSEDITIPEDLNSAFDAAYAYLIINPISRSKLPVMSSYVQGIINAANISALISAMEMTLDNIPDGATNKAYTSTEKSKLSSLASVATSGSYNDLSNKPSIPSSQVNSDWSAGSGIAQILNKPTTLDSFTDGATNKAYTATEKTKLAGIASGATANDTDANLKNRANHTGTQAESTITNLTSDLANRPLVYFGSTQKSGAIFYTGSATVSSGTAVFQLTADGTSGGTAIFPNGPNMDSINAFVSDAMASYQMGYALTNSNKTLTITANKLTTANILTGILGQTAANSAVVRLSIWGS